MCDHISLKIMRQFVYKDSKLIMVFNNLTHVNDVIFLFLGTFLIEKVVPQSSGDSSKVKVKVRIDSNGIFKIAQASMVEKLGEEESAQNEQMDVDDEKKNEEKKNGEANASMEEETKEAGSEETPMQTDEAPTGENSTEQAGDESQPMSNSDEKLAVSDVVPAM